MTTIKMINRCQLETFYRYWIFGTRNHRSPVGSADKGQWRGALKTSLSAHKQTIKQTTESPVITDAIALSIPSL